MQVQNTTSFYGITFSVYCAKALFQEYTKILTNAKQEAMAQDIVVSSRIQ